MHRKRWRTKLDLTWEIFIVGEVIQLLVSDGNYNLNLHSNEAWPL